MHRQAISSPERLTTHRAGFTLLEVMLAITIAFTVLLMARAMIEQLNAADRRLDLASRAEARTRNSERAVIRAFDRLEVGTDSLRIFVGDVGHMTFTSWCDASGGWLERCEMKFSIDTVRAGSALLLQSSLGDSIVVRTGFLGGSFRYIDDVDDPKAWVWRWGPGNTAPTVIAFVTARDTMLYRIGPRG
jgi:prepilin-type N-terminal cleavage/methylation domain-containing protein